MLNITNHQRWCKPSNLMQIKTTVRYHLTPVRMAIMSQSTNNKCWWRCEKREHLCTVGGNADWCNHYGKQYEDTSKIKNGSAVWPSYPISANTCISEETQNTNSKEHKHPYIHCSIINNHQDIETAQMSITRWVGKRTMGHLQMEYYSAIEKKKILPFVTTGIDPKNIMLSEISQSEKDKYHMISLICRT